MKCFFGYHKAHTHGTFGGVELFTGNKLSLNQSSNFIYVVSGKKTQPTDQVHYQLEGKFSIENCIRNKSGRFAEKEWQLVLKPIVILDPPRSLEGNSEFDKQWWTNKLRLIQGAREIRRDERELINLFEAIISNSESLAQDLLLDLADINHDSGINDETERQELRNARVGQGRFRKNIIDVWGGKERCAVTAIQIPEMLNASHIIAWRDSSNSQRLSGANGILLCTHLDRLFDRHLIGFKKISQSDIYKIVFSNRLKGQMDSLKLIGITSLLKLDLAMVKFVSKPEVEQNLGDHLIKLL